MARETLDDALRLTFGDEGGYSNVETDAGGPTKYGITHKTLAAHRGVPKVSAEQVKALTLAEAAEIYRQGYWTQSGGDLLPKGLDYAVFNSGVMSGPARAVKILQRVVGVVEDGNAGLQTLKAVEAYPPGVRRLIVDYCSAYMEFLRGIKGKQGFASNGRGWTIRITGKDPKKVYADKPGVVGNALRLAGGADVVASAPESPPVPAGGDAKALPTPVNPWTKPETIGTVVAGAATAVTPIIAGRSLIEVAVALGIVVVIAIVGFAAFRRIKSTPV